MKKLLFLFATVLLLSCSSDDSNNSTTGNSIVGKWNLQNILTYGQSEGGGSYTCNKEFDITEFKSNGILITKYSNNVAANCIQLTDNGTYLIEGDILTDTQMNGSIKIFEAVYKIKTLTSTTLKLESISLFESSSDGVTQYNDVYQPGEEVKVYVKIN